MTTRIDAIYTRGLVELNLWYKVHQVRPTPKNQRRDRKEAYRDKMRKAGACYYCGRDLMPGSNKCPYHYFYARKNGREQYRKWLMEHPAYKNSIEV